MSEPILIPVKASEDLPKEEGTYFIDLNTDKPGMVGKNVSWFRPNYDNEAWKENINYWYKPVSEDDLFPTTEELNKPNDSVEWMCGAVWAINFIKSKLTEK